MLPINLELEVTFKVNPKPYAIVDIPEHQPEFVSGTYIYLDKSEDYMPALHERARIKIVYSPNRVIIRGKNSYLYSFCKITNMLWTRNDYLERKRCLFLIQNKWGSEYPPYANSSESDFLTGVIDENELDSILREMVW